MTNAANEATAHYAITVLQADGQEWTYSHAVGPKVTESKVRRTWARRMKGYAKYVRVVSIELHQ